MFVVEITYDCDLYGERDHRFECETVEEAAQRYESEAEPGALPKVGCDEPWRSSHPLSQIVEELGWEGLRLESFDPETRKRVVAYELVEAVV